jgi:hypothetical protein
MLTVSVTAKITIRIKTEAQKLGEAQKPPGEQKTDYQRAVEKIITDPNFQQFLTRDNFLASNVEYLEGQLNNTTDSAAKENNIQAEIDSLKQQRLNNLGSYLQSLVNRGK